MDELGSGLNNRNSPGRNTLNQPLPLAHNYTFQEDREEGRDAGRASCPSYSPLRSSGRRGSTNSSPSAGKHRMSAKEIERNYKQQKRNNLKAQLELELIQRSPRGRGDSSPLRQRSNGSTRGLEDQRTEKSVRFEQHPGPSEQANPVRPYASQRSTGILRNKSSGRKNNHHNDFYSLPHEAVERPLIIPQPVPDHSSYHPASFQSVPLRQKSGSNRHSASRSRSASASRRGDHSPLRQKSPASNRNNSSVGRDEVRGSARQPRQSNKDLRNQYYRQINLCKKGSLNFYETSTFVGFLLDMIYMSRRLEELKVKLIQSSDHFNLYDAWMLIEPKAYTGNPGRITPVDLRESLLRHLVKAEKVTMDRLTLFFNRYNQS